MTAADPLIRQLAAERARRGWSVYRLAQESGVSLPTIQRAESGQYAPGLATLRLLAAPFGLRLTLVPATSQEGPQ